MPNNYMPFTKVPVAMNKGSLFVTGTNTGVGKTFVSGQLARAIRAAGPTFVPQKWVQTGTQDGDNDLDSILDIMGASSDEYAPFLSHMQVYGFSYPASPHLAAQLDQRNINLMHIQNSYRHLQQHFDWVLVEGAGGVMVPLNEQTTLLDLVAELKIPTLLVVDNRLGAINHALLSLQALALAKVPVLGMVFTQTQAHIDPVIRDDNRRIIPQVSGIPVLADLGHCQPHQAFNISCLDPVIQALHI